MTILCLSALFYTKESGLVVGVVLGLDALTGLFKKENNMKTRIMRCLVVALPCVLIGIFFIIQKQVRGWYIFPLHDQLIEHNWQSYWTKFRIACVRGAFYDNLKFYYFLVLMLLSITASVKSKNFRFLALLVPATIIYYFIDDMRAGGRLPSRPFFILFLLSIFYFLYIYSSSKNYVKTQQRFIVLTGLFVLSFLCFSAMNFITYRYLLAAIIPLLFLTSVFFDLLVSQSFKILYYPLLGVILLISFFSFKLNDSYGDTDLGAYDAMYVQQSLANYMQEHNYYNRSISSGSFLTQQSLLNPDCGYTTPGKTFAKVQWNIDGFTDIAMFDNINADNRYDMIKKDTGFTLVYRYQKGKIWGEIYKRGYTVK